MILHKLRNSLTRVQVPKSERVSSLPFKSLSPVKRVVFSRDKGTALVPSWSIKTKRDSLLSYYDYHLSNVWRKVGNQVLTLKSCWRLCQLPPFPECQLVILRTSYPRVEPSTLVYSECHVVLLVECFKAFLMQGRSGKNAWLNMETSPCMISLSVNTTPFAIHLQKITIHLCPNLFQYGQ